MKKLGIFVTLIVFVAGFLFISNDEAFAWRKKKKEPKVEEVKPAPVPDDSKLVYTFNNDQEMQEFEQILRTKQAAFIRMDTLRLYFQMERNTLAEMDKQILEKFGFQMEGNRNYDLNRDTKELRDLGARPSPPASLATE